MKRKMTTSLILTVFLAVMVLCFVHSAMMTMPMAGEDCVISAKQAVCPVGLMGSWRDLTVAMPIKGIGLFFGVLISIFLYGVLIKKIEQNLVLLPIRLYTKTYPNFSSLNFLSYAFRRGILHSKVF